MVSFIFTLYPNLHIFFIPARKALNDSALVACYVAERSSYLSLLL